MTQEQQVLSGHLVDDATTLSIEQLCAACNATPQHIVDLVHEGILDAMGYDSTVWSFSSTSLSRARIALRLQRDLEINLAGVALALNLLDEIATLEAQLKER